MEAVILLGGPGTGKGTAASLLSVVVLAKGKSLPSSDNDLSTVQEIVS